MSYCAHCGAEVNEEAVICTKCGCAVDSSKNPLTNSNSNNYNTLAIVGFVLSFFSAVVALILSCIAFKQIKTSGEKGRGLAIAGIVIASIETAFIVLYVVLYASLLLGYFAFLFAVFA